eukprot:Tbor_TRINITY_DN5845_c0_g4::TRINITY_DN5845_c0_g4_i1::g.6528::m.6528/K02994/RP-S8, rpsH; small subunit ribosomal protein S8
MLRKLPVALARIVGGGPTWMGDVGMGKDHTTDEGRYLGDMESHPRQGIMKCRTVLGSFVPADEGYHQKKLVDLPGVKFSSDLPADPITRLFFQTSGENELHRGTFQHPALTDEDRIQIERRDTNTRLTRQLYTVTYDFCHRLREGSDQRKRFVVVPATHVTKGCAQVLFNHGLIAGFRDFNNDRAFVVELKYFQNEPVLQVIEPAAKDRRVEFVWSPKMMRRFKTSYGVSNHIRIFILRTHDGRIIDHLDAVNENIGGIGLLMAF